MNTYTLSSCHSGQTPLIILAQKNRVFDIDNAVDRSSKGLYYIIILNNCIFMQYYNEKKAVEQKILLIPR